MECDRIHSVLEDLTTCGPEKVPDILLDLIKKKWKENDADGFTDFEMKWIVIRGKDAFHENSLLLTEAVEIFHVSFAYIPQCCRLFHANLSVHLSRSQYDLELDHETLDGRTS